VPVVVEQLLGPVAVQPQLQQLQLVVVAAHVRQRYLVGTPGALHREAVQLLGAGPALRGTQHDHRPPGPFGDPLLARPPLVPVDVVERPVQGGGQRLVHRGRLVAGHQVGGVPVALEQLGQLLVGEPGQHRGIADLVPVQVQDRQHRPVPDRVEELVGVPGGCQWPGLRLPVADHAGHHQARVVEGGAVGVR
jgi:hypothetical protein